MVQVAPAPAVGQAVGAVEAAAGMDTAARPGDSIGEEESPVAVFDLGIGREQEVVGAVPAAASADTEAPISTDQCAVVVEVAEPAIPSVAQCPLAVEVLP